MTSFLIVAGENSGEKYGADFIRAYRRLDPSASFFGIGGPEMAAAGAELIFPVEDLSIIGIGEAILSYPRLRRMLRRLMEEVEARQPAAAVLIDSPDFNLRLALRLRPIGLPVLYYISPTVWAWRRGRLRSIRQAVSRMLLIFPFEKEIYDRANIPAVYVGHPLKERIAVRMTAATFRQKYGLSPDQPLLSLLPGSRASEVRRHLPILIKTIEIIRKEIKASFLLLKAETVDKKLIQGQLEDHPEVIILEEDKYEAMASSDLILAACGTANMEACLIGTPFIAFYRISPLFYHLGKGLVKIQQYSIVNILAGHKVVPELIQPRFTPENLAREALFLLSSPERKETMKEEFEKIRRLLGEEKASEKAAAELYRLVQRTPA